MADQANITDTEEWRDVPGWEGFYQVSSHGRVKRLPRFVRTKNDCFALKMGGILAPSKNKRTGYPETLLSDGARKQRVNIHVLVCEAFHGPRPSSRHQVAHGDGSRDYNHKDNLRWASPKDNAADRKRHGTEYEGKAHWKTELTEDDVRSIRDRYKPGHGGYTYLAREYGLTRGAIYRIVKRKNWKHVE